MRILKREKITPINLYPGDMINLEYTDENGKRTTVMSDTVTEYHKFDEAAVFALDESDKKELGVKDGLGGVFMEKDPNA